MEAEPTIVVERRKELTYLLCQAAELEHGLMCEYLYAAFSLKSTAGPGLRDDQLEAVESCRCSSPALFVWFYNVTAFSVLMMAIFHAGFDGSINQLSDDIVPASNTAKFLIFSAVIVLVAMIVIIATKDASGEPRGPLKLRPVSLIEASSRKLAFRSAPVGVDATSRAR